MFQLSKKLGLALMSLSLAIAASAAASTALAGDFGTLRPFSTDGCTDFPDGPPGNPNLWLECCVHHDLLYWAGGSHEDKLHADEFLFKCISKKSNPILGAIMFAGVTIGGTPFIKDPARWGYGWPKLRGYHKLSEDELEQVRQLTPQNMDQIIEQFSR